MPFAKPTRITSWSYSRWTDYDTCPKKAYYKHVAKDKEPGNAAMDRGSEIHDEAEGYLKVAGRRMPKSLSKFAERFRELRKLGAKSEASWTFRNDWSITSATDWDGAWARIKADAVYDTTEERATIIDFKTGRIKTEGYQLQLELYAVAAFTVFPDLQEVDTQLWYLDHYPEEDVNPTSMLYTRDEYARLRKGWEKRVTPMLRDVTFKEKPGRECSWCYFSSTINKNSAKYPGGEGGPCKY